MVPNFHRPFQVLVKFQKTLQKRRRSGQPSESRNRTNKKVRQIEKRTENETTLESAFAVWKLSLAEVWIGWLFVGAIFKIWIIISTEFDSCWMMFCSRKGIFNGTNVNVSTIICLKSFLYRIDSDNWQWHPGIYASGECHWKCNTKYQKSKSWIAYCTTGIDCYLGTTFPEISSTIVEDRKKHYELDVLMDKK